MTSSVGMGGAMSPMMRMRPPGGMRDDGSRPDAATMAKHFLEAFDSDGDGTVTRTEISSALSDQGRHERGELASKRIVELGGSGESVSE